MSRADGMFGCGSRGDRIPSRPLPPFYKPLERFWPYAELPEQPTDEELAALHPELRQALFGAPDRPFSISLVFPEFGGFGYSRAVDLARASDEYIETTHEGVRRHRARFYPRDRPARLRDLYTLVKDTPGLEVLVDDQPVPYAKELWLPLVWLLLW
jgi:hypothetical protein